VPTDATDGTDATQADLPHETQLGTQAASPRALADVAVGSRSTELQEARPTGWATASGRPVATAAEALDRSDLSRMRAFHTFGVLAPVGAILLSLLLGGDPVLRNAFRVGASLLSVCNVGLE
jgi:hypothetical protein